MARNRAARGPLRLLRGSARVLHSGRRNQEATMDGIIYLIGLIVVIMAVLSFFGLR